MFECQFFFFLFTDDIVVVLFIGFYQPGGGFPRQTGSSEAMGGRRGFLFPPRTTEGEETGRSQASGSGTEEKTSRATVPGTARSHHAEQAAQTSPGFQALSASVRAGGEASSAELRERGGPLPGLP